MKGLRQRASALRDLLQGRYSGLATRERLLVTDRNKVVAELGPAPSTGEALDRLKKTDGRRFAPTASLQPRQTRVVEAYIEGEAHPLGTIVA